MNFSQRLGQALVLVFFAGCAGGPTNPDGLVASGTWGGDHLRLTIGATSASVEFDCAHGFLPVPLVLQGGQFDVIGVFVPEHGGPIRVDEQPPELSARYNGVVDRGRMTLRVELVETHQDLGTYSLALGSAGRVFKCL